MNSELTPFPDGEGYFEHVWEGLSRYARTTLDELERDVALSWTHPQVWRGLERRGLVTYAYSNELTDRGRALARWAHETGRSPA